MRGISRLALIAGFSLLAAGQAAPPAAASTLGVDFAASPTVFSSNGWNMGYSFHVNNSVLILGLGAFDEFPVEETPGCSPSPNPCAFSNFAQHVGLWDLADDSLVADAYVNGSSTQIGLFAFSFISPQTLQAGHDYVVGAQGGGPFAEFTSLTVDPNISFIEGLGAFTNGTADPLVEPNFQDGDFLAGNILVDVPEPMSLSLFGVALAGLGLMRRRRKG